MNDEDDDKQRDESGLQINEPRKNGPKKMTLAVGSIHQGNCHLKSKISFTIRGVRVYLKVPDRPIGGFWIKADVTDWGTINPNAWAPDSRPEDPGSRLAIHIGLKDIHGRETDVFYPKQYGSTWACKANMIMDVLDGYSDVEIARRPRRYVYKPNETTGDCKSHPFLKGFVGGGYTDDDGNLIPHERGQKRPRKIKGEAASETESRGEEDERDSKKKKGAKMVEEERRKDR